jgi:hypothetical protein
MLNCYQGLIDTVTVLNLTAFGTKYSPSDILYTQFGWELDMLFLKQIIFASEI